MLPIPFKAVVVGHWFTIEAYVTRGAEPTVRYKVTVRTWSPRSSTTYIANDDDLLKLRDWINSALIAKHARKLGD